MIMISVYGEFHENSLKFEVDLLSISLVFKWLKFPVVLHLLETCVPIYTGNFIPLPLQTKKK